MPCSVGSDTMQQIHGAGVQSDLAAYTQNPLLAAESAMFSVSVFLP